jgi:hypothetical protein
MSASEDTEKMEDVLRSAAREFAKHSGPQSDERERATFFRDLRTAALRFARAYYAEARELGLIPESERTKCPAHWGEFDCVRPSGHEGTHTSAAGAVWQHGADDRKPDGMHGVWRGNVGGGCENCGRGYALHGSEDRCPERKVAR